MPGLVVTNTLNYGTAPISIRGIGAPNGGGGVFNDQARGDLCGQRLCRTARRFGIRPGGHGVDPGVARPAGDGADYVKNAAGENRQIGGSRDKTVRATLRFLPVDTLTLDLIGEYQEQVAHPALFSIALLDDFILRANLLYLDAELRRGTLQALPSNVSTVRYGAQPFPPPAVFPSEDVAGNRMTRAPEWQYYLNGEYTWNLTAHALRLSATWRGQSSVFFSETNHLDAEVIVPGHGPVTDAAGVTAVRTYLEYVDAEASKRFAAGLDVEQAALDIALGVRGVGRCRAHRNER